MSVILVVAQTDKQAGC